MAAVSGAGGSRFSSGPGSGPSFKGMVATEGPSQAVLGARPSRAVAEAGGEEPVALLVLGHGGGTACPTSIHTFLAYEVPSWTSVRYNGIDVVVTVNHEIGRYAPSAARFPKLYPG